MIRIITATTTTTTIRTIIIKTSVTIIWIANNYKVIFSGGV